MTHMQMIIEKDNNTTDTNTGIGKPIATNPTSNNYFEIDDNDVIIEIPQDMVHDDPTLDDNIDNDDEVIEIPHDMFDKVPNHTTTTTTSTTTSSTSATNTISTSTTTSITSSIGTTAAITENQVMPKIIEENSNHDEFTVSKKYYGIIDKEIFCNEKSKFCL